MKFTYDDALELLVYLREEFGGGWERNARISMQDGTAEELIMIVKNKDDKICGFCMRAIDKNPMRFGPIGISKSERSAGLGSVLLNLYFADMSQHGVFRMYFITTDAPGRRYYERNGLEVIRSFVEYAKEL